MFGSVRRTLSASSPPSVTSLGGYASTTSGWCSVCAGQSMTGEFGSVLLMHQRYPRETAPGRLCLEPVGEGWGVGLGAPLGAGPLSAAKVGARGYRSPTQRRE